MEVSLAPLTLHRHEPLDTIDAAARAGYDSCGIALKRLGEPLSAVARESGGGARAEDALGAADITLLEVSNVILGEQFELEEVTAMVRFASRAGGRLIQVIGWEPDAAKAAEGLRAVADLAGDAGLGVVLEFMPYAETKTIADAVALIDAARRPNVAVLLDSLHLFRSGGSVAEVAALEPGVVAVLQLSDAPKAPPAPAQLRAESIADRLLPGEGELPLRQLMHALPPGLPVSLEIPCRALEDRPHAVQAQVVLDRFRRFEEGLR